MKILVTGGAGYIGSHAVKLLLGKKHQVVVIDNLSRGYLEAIETLSDKFGKKVLRFYQADLLDYGPIEKILRKEKPEAVMHFAAFCQVDESMEKPEMYFENNVFGSLNLLKAMARAQVRDFVFSSTSEIYGESEYLPVDEKHPLNPATPYGESKFMVERMLPWFEKVHNLKYVILRYFNVSGADSEGLIGDSKKPSCLLVQNAVRGALNIEPFQLVCPPVDTPDGTTIRDYINVEDLVEAHWDALCYLQKGGKSDVFNLGTGAGNSVLEIISKVQKITGIKFPVGRGKTRKGETAAKYADISKARKILNWKPKRAIKDSVLSLTKWYKKRPQGWER
jgi:UDP-glucose 4-epimerase